MKWLRLYHDAPNDPKWRLVSAESGQCEGLVLAVWVHMMVCASAARDRGRLEGWDDRVVAASMGVKCAVVTSIREAMQGITLDGDALTGWDKRQKTASDDAAERQRRARANRHENPPDGTGGGEDYGPNGSHHSNGMSRDSSHMSRDSSQHSNDPTRNDASRDSEPTSRDNVDMSRDKEAMSRERHATNSNVAENPLSLTLLPTPTSMQKDLLAPPIGGAGKKVEFDGENFRLSAQKLAEWQRCYSAIPDFMATMQTIDAGLAGCKNPFAEARRQLLNQHLYWTSHDPKKPQAKPKTANRAGVRKLGGRNAA
jgi:hypothetical protein